MSKKDVATMTGLDEHVIADYYYERVKMFRVDTLVKFCQAFGLKSISELVEYAPDEKSSKQQRNPLSSLMDKIKTSHP